MTDIRNSKPYRLSAAAWTAALGDRWDAASRYVQRISNECGGEGLSLALTAWCDTMINHACDGVIHAGRLVGAPSFIRVDTGQLDGPDSPQVPERIRWAGRLIQARAAMDDAAWKALVAEMPGDGYEIGRYVSAVLKVTTRSVNGLPRGYANPVARRAWADS